MNIGIMKSKTDTLIVLLATLIINGYFVVNIYGWSDDFSFALQYDEIAISGENIARFRPISEIAFALTFPLIESTSDFSFFRAVSTIGVALVALKIKQICLFAGYGKMFSLFLAIGVMVLPSISIYWRWATAFLFSWVLLMGLFSADSYFKGKRMRSFVMAIIAFLTYQPAATAGIIVATILFLKDKIRLTAIFVFTIWLALAFSIATALSALLLELLDVETTGREKLVDSPMAITEKLIWVLTRPLVLMLRPFLVDSPTLVEAATSTIFFGGLVLVGILIKHGISKMVHKLIGFFVLFLAGLIPLLITQENQIEFRTLASTSILGLILTMDALKSILEKLRARRYATWVACVALSLLIAYNFNWSRQVFLVTYNNNYNCIVSYLKDESSVGRGPMTYVAGDAAPWPQRDYVGALSMISDLQSPWVFPGFFALSFGTVPSRIVDAPNYEAKIDLNLIREKLVLSRTSGC